MSIAPESVKTTRSPILVIMGHVDHGKTSLADSIRGTRVAKKEAGGITQMIGASYLPRETLEVLSSKLSEKMRFTLKIPGLLFIDTPGHEAFTNLRERGGSIADMAILVVDIAQGFQPQTIESIKILKQFKTPFVIAANKVDLITGWKNQDNISIMESLAKQREDVRTRLDEKIYSIVGKISEYGFDSERFDRVTDFAKQISIIPVSAKTKEGLSELLVVVAGLSQKFLEENLKTDASGTGKGSVLEIKEEKGLGSTIDVVLYDGAIKKNDEIIYLTETGAKTTRIRGLLEPDIKGKEKYAYIDQVYAAAGVKIFAPGLENVIPGSPFKVVENLEKDKQEIEQQFKNVLSESEEEGVIVKADSLGSVEAILKLLKDADIKVHRAGVGKIGRKDVINAHAMGGKNHFYGAVLGFNNLVLNEARQESSDSNTPIIWSNIIYDVLDKYQDWVKEEKEKERLSAMENLPFPGKIYLIPGFMFRASKPAIFGVEVKSGRIKKGYCLMNKRGDIVGEIREIQHEKEKVEEAKAIMQIAISCDGINYGKNVEEKEELYTYITSEEAQKWEAQKELLTGEEKALLNEIRNMLKKYF